MLELHAHLPRSGLYFTYSVHIFHEFQENMKALTQIIALQILNRHMVRRIINNNSRTRYELITKNRSRPLTLHIDVTLNERA